MLRCSASLQGAEYRSIYVYMLNKRLKLMDQLTFLHMDYHDYRKYHVVTFHIHVMTVPLERLKSM